MWLMICTVIVSWYKRGILLSRLEIVDVSGDAATVRRLLGQSNATDACSRPSGSTFAWLCKHHQPLLLRSGCEPSWRTAVLLRR